MTPKTYAASDVAMMIVAKVDEETAALTARAAELEAALRELVERCDGAEGVRADGSNIDTCAAHAALGDFASERPRRAGEGASMKYRAPNPITRYWLDHYVHKGLCSLCGQTGMLDTRGMKSPAGVECGRVNFCICPNGQARAALAKGQA